MKPSLKIAGIEVSIASWLDFDQKIEPIGGTVTRRLASGKAFKLFHWRRHRITLSASGWVPAPLLAVDYDHPFALELPLPVAFNAGESLPDGWAARPAPWDEHPYTDQIGRTVRFIYPLLTVTGEPPQVANNHGAAPAWELIMETV